MEFEDEVCNIFSVRCESKVAQSYIGDTTDISSKADPIRKSKDSLGY